MVRGSGRLGAVPGEQALRNGLDLDVRLVLEAVDHAPELDRDLVVASQRWLAEVTEQEISAWGFQEATVWIDFADWALDYGLIEVAIDPLAAFSNAHLPGESAEEAEEGSSEG